MEQKGPKREDRIVFYAQGKDEGNSWFDILQMLAMILSFNAVFFKVIWQGEFFVSHGLRINTSIG